MGAVGAWIRISHGNCSLSGLAGIARSLAQMAVNCDTGIQAPTQDYDYDQYDYDEYYNDEYHNDEYDNNEYHNANIIMTNIIITNIIMRIV